MWYHVGSWWWELPRPEHTRNIPKYLRCFRDHSQVDSTHDDDDDDDEEEDDDECETRAGNLIMKVKSSMTMIILYQQPIMMNTFGVQDQLINPNWIFKR